MRPGGSVSSPGHELLWTRAASSGRRAEWVCELGGELIVNEVRRPEFIKPLRRRDGDASHGWKLAAAFATKGEAFHAVRYG